MIDQQQFPDMPKLGLFANRFNNSSMTMSEFAGRPIILQTSKGYDEPSNRALQPTASRRIV